MNEKPKAQEGTLYKTVTVEGREFQIYFGYRNESERERWDPEPIYPDFIKAPEFTVCGKPIVRADQDTCSDYEPKESVSGEDWCNDCVHFKKYEDFIGVCQCMKKKHIIRQNE